MDTRLGRVVFSERGYMVMEFLEAHRGGNVRTGFTLLGPQASASIIYSTRREAIDALGDIEARAASASAAAAES